MHLTGVRPSVRLSVCLSVYRSVRPVRRRRTPQQQTLALCLGRQEILIDCCTAHRSAACGGRMRAVPRRQRT